MNKYLVAKQYKAEPNVCFADYQIIAADTPDEAANIYNEKNNCNYFHASVIKEVDADENDVEFVLNGIREHLKKFGINPNII